MLHIDCRCGKRLNIPESNVGKSGKCPSCKRRIHLVSPDSRPGPDAYSACLLGIAGPQHVGDQFFICAPGPIQVGKTSDTHIRLIDPKVSRSHCRLVHTGHGWRIEDQASTNGVFVNGQRVDACDLRDSDLIRLGNLEFKYLTTLEETPAAPVRPRPPKRQTVGVVSVKAKKSPPDEGEIGLSDDDLFSLADGDAAEPAAVAALPVQKFAPGESTTVVGGPVCPSCKKSLPPDAKICIQCGINIQTGRAILTVFDGDIDRIYATAESVVQLISWIIPFGIYPVASEAFGTKKPYVIRGNAVLTVLASLWFLALLYTGSPGLKSSLNLMLWAGTLNTEMSQQTSLAEDELSDEIPSSNETLDDSAVDEVATAEFDIPGYHPSQLLTHAFLHAGILHLAGNLLFMLVFGSRVNALIGNIATAAVYPVLAIMAALFHLAANENQPLHPMLGASGAVMGLAGLYLVLFPLHKVHVVLWYRLGLIFGFRLSFKLFAVRGFGVVLFYIAFDVLFTAIGVEDNVAHWAHLGGFIAGMVLGLAMLTTRLVHGRGGDLVSVLLGKYAWSIIGKPNRDRAA